MDLSIRHKLESCRTLPTLPAIASELVRLCENDDTDIAELSALIGKDPAIAAKILRVANSVMFVGRAGPAMTTNQAVTRLGKSSVMTLSLSFSLVNMRLTRPEGFDLQRFWKRTLLAGTTAGYVAELVKVSREEAFLAGMFQDIGMLVMHEALGSTYGDAVAPAGRDHLRLERHERETFGSDHREVGAWLARTWGLPDYLISTTLGSHNPSSQDGARSSHAALVKCVALSGYVADIWAGSEDRAATTRQAAECARMWLDANGETFTRLLSQVARAVPELSRLYEIAVDEKALGSTLELAKDTLVKVALRSAQSARESSARSSEANTNAGAPPARDPATGLATRSHFDRQLSAAFTSARELGGPLSVVFCELDDAATLLAKHGPKVHEAALLALGKTLVRCARQLDVPTRYQDDQFAILLPGTDRAGAMLAAQRLQRMCDKLEVPIGQGRMFSLRSSFGCATADELFPAESPALLLKEADACLFKARREGGNRIVSHG